MANAPIINAIPTTYKGITFRSRTEARWAVFLDQLPIEWQYEAEGYQLQSGWYVPDFWLPDLDVFLEVKPSFRDGIEKANELSATTGKSVYITDGGPAFIDRDGGGPRLSLCGDEWHTFVMCGECGAWGIYFEGEQGEQWCDCPRNWMRRPEWWIDPAIEFVQKYNFWNPGGAR